MAKQEKKQSSISPLALLAGALVLIAVVAFAVLQNKREDQQTPNAENTVVEPAPQAQSSQNSSQESFRMPPYLQPAELTNLAPTKDPATVNPGAMSAYLVAQQKPQLIAQLPCFCYCDRFGHGSLHECFVSDHAQSCDICLKEALKADELDKQGMPANEIRDMIVAQFHPREGDHVH